MNSALKQLTYLRSRLASGGASLLVGSGFSKNAHSEFPLWREALHDMVVELNQHEIDRETHNLSDKVKATKDIVHRIIDQTGLLEVVSLYIQRKGFAESIVGYIEERIPIIEDDGVYQLKLKTGTIPLTPEHLRLHKRLISLPWNNIYTTNIDPLLEACVDTKAFARLIDQNIALAKEIEELDPLLTQERQERDKIQQLIRELHEKSGGEDVRAGRKFRTSKQDEKAPQPLSEQEKDELNKLYEKQDGLVNSILNKEQRIREAGTVRVNNEKAKLHTYTVVSNGSELQLKKNKNIIKLHGNLRSKKDRQNSVYGFDGDPHKQYVFSREHFDRYPQEHQAFTQLMRISLLQECFCLIGFSGVDPNFQSWISWVRDILVRHTQKSGSKSYKIFLLDMNATAASASENLFYENHSIVRIPLLAQETIDALSGITKSVFDPEHPEASILSMLFRFFEMDEEISLSQITSKDTQYEKRWELAWDSLSIYGFDSLNDEKIEENLRIIQSVVQQLPKLYFGRYKSRDLTQFLMIVDDHLLKVSAGSRGRLLQLAAIASRYSFVPIRSLLSKDIYKEMLERRESASDTRMLLMRNDTFYFPDKTDESELLHPFDAILRAAYSLKYDELKQLLIHWEPELADMHQKAGMLAWFDQEAAEELLLSQINSGAVEGQGLLLSLEMLALVKSRTVRLGKDDTKVRIEAMKANGYIEFTAMTEFLTDQGKEKPEKLKPYGKGRFTLSRNMFFGGDAKAIPALQLMCLLAESGFSLELGYRSVIGSEEWYPLFKRGFEHYPLPFLYYSLQLHREDTLARIAQDYAFSDTVNHQQLVVLLQQGYRTIPDSRKDSVLVVLSELIKVVEPIKWQELFAEVFTANVKNGKLFEQVHNDEVKSFVRNGISLISDINLIFSLVGMLLKHPQHPIADYLYYFSTNVYYKALAPATVPDNLRLQIDAHISDQYNLVNDFFSFGNLFYILSDAQKERIKEKIVSADLSKATHPKIWRVMSFFTKEDPALESRLKEAVLQSSLLWYTGINGKEISGSMYGIMALTPLTKSEKYPHGFSWTDDEIFRLYKKLKVSWAQVQTVNEDHEYVGFEDLLDEMNRFLIMHEQLLSSDSMFQGIKEAIWGRLVRSRKYASIEEGLVSSDQTIALWALGDLEVLADNEAVDTDLRLLFLNKIYMQAGAAIEACLNLLASWVKAKKAAEGFSPYIPNLLGILQRYKDHSLPESDIYYVERQMVTIAHTLLHRGVVSSIIDYWRERALNTRSVFVRQRYGDAQKWITVDSKW